LVGARRSILRSHSIAATAQRPGGQAASARPAGLEIDLAGAEIGLEIELRPMSGGGVKGGGSQRDPASSTASSSTASAAAAGGVAGATGA